MLAVVDAAPVWPKPNPPVWPKAGAVPTCWPKGEAAVVGACPKTDCPVAADCANIGGVDATGFQNGVVAAVVVDGVNVVPPKMEGVLVPDAVDVVVPPNIAGTFALPVACPNKDGVDMGAVVLAAAWPNVNGDAVVVVVAEVAVVATACCAPKGTGAVDDVAVTCGIPKACATEVGEAAVVVAGA